MYSLSTFLIRASSKQTSRSFRTNPFREHLFMPMFAVHFLDYQNTNEEFTEREVIELYLNNKITSSQQVLIYNIDNHSPK